MYIFHSHQSILLLAEDHLVMVVHVPKVLCYGEAAEAVTRVVKISGPGHTKTIKQGSDVKTLRMSKAVQICSVCVCAQMVWYWLARLIQKASCWVLTAQEDVLLQGLLLKHPPLLTQLWLSWANTQVSHKRGKKKKNPTKKKPGWSHRKFRLHFQHENVNTWLFPVLTF